MLPALYGELVPWYRLLDPMEDHAEEGEGFTQAFETAVIRPETLLELGSGAGHNAYHLKHKYRTTLADLSEPMLGLSRELNPECEHQQGDMRTLRLGREFDLVLLHDAIVYMTTPEDLLAAIKTAYVHTRSGGAAVFAPDCFAETFHEASTLYDGADANRAMRCVEWMWDPDANDTQYQVDYAFLLRDGKHMRAVHDSHIEGVFSRETWRKIFTSVGYRPEPLARPLGDGTFDEVFLCRKP